MATLEEFLARAIVPCESLLALDLNAAETAAALAETRETLGSLNEDFEESTMPGGKPGWFAMSSLMSAAIGYCKQPGPATRDRLIEAIDKAREHA